MRPAAAIPLLALVTACSAAPDSGSGFAADADFLRRHAGGLTLHSGTGAFVVTPPLQGRVMTSTVGDGRSLGFVHRAAIADPPARSAFFNYGGEDRFWLGPEGGPYSLYFPPGAAFALENWQVPAAVNEGAFAVTHADAREVTMTRDLQVSNRLGSRFELRLQRTVAALDAAAAERLLQAALPAGCRWTGFLSRNRVENTGAAAWQRASGLPCVWILGMFAPGPRTFVIAPVAPQAGTPVQTGYFGALGPDRLRRGTNFVLFRADAQYRSKIGLYPEQVRIPALAAYDPDAKILTVVRFTPFEARGAYLNELWDPQHPDPYHGDVANSYNHGGPEPFFELESSSPALELAPGQAHEHFHATVHLQLEGAELAAVAAAALGVDWAEVSAAAGW